LITIMASIAQQESQSISQNVRIGIQYQMQQGHGRLNTSVFMGLRKGDAPDTLVIIPEEAAIVRRIYRQFLEGYSPAMICRNLEADGIMTKSGGTTWYPSTITGMLENEKYSGDLLLQKYFTVDFLTKKVEKNTGQFPQYFVENHHEPIIPKLVYYQVQGGLMRRGALKNDPTKLRFGKEMALSGRLVCGKCGRVLKRYTKPDENATDWRCRNRAYNKKTNTRDCRSVCGCRFVRETDAKRAIVEAFNRLHEYRDELIAHFGRGHFGCDACFHASFVRYIALNGNYLFSGGIQFSSCRFYQRKIHIKKSNPCHIVLQKTLRNSSSDSFSGTGNHCIPTSQFSHFHFSFQIKY